MSKTKKNEFTVNANLDSKTFIRFALFDAFRRKKLWRLPVLFACIMTVSALICLSAIRSKPQAVLPGVLLLVIGLLLPVVWFLFFYFSVRAEAKKHQLSPDKTQYVLILAEDNLKVVTDKERAEFAWNDLYTAYRVKGCIYLYVTPARAFLLPDGDSHSPEEVWNRITDLGRFRIPPTPRA